MSRLISAHTLIVLLVSTLVATTQAQTTWYVDDDAPNDPGPGDPTVSDPNENGTPEHPFDAIQEAIFACQHADTVLVLDGTYTGVLNKDLDLGGLAITVRSENGPENCVIDCEADGRAFQFRFGEGPDSVVEGFTMTGGNPSEFGGGAIYCRDASSPTIRNCIMSANAVSGDGGAVYCHGASNPTIVYCSITENTATDDGGAISCSYSDPTITNCTIAGNTATSSSGSDGGAVYCYHSDPTIANCAITGNVAMGGSYYGGGGVCSYGGSPAIVNCTIGGNRTNRDGGGIRCLNAHAQGVTIINCAIAGNEADNGGAVYCSSSDALIANCTIVNNSATATAGRGAGVYCYAGNLLMANCTTSGNPAPEYGGAVYCSGASGTITSSVLWGDAADEGPEIALRSSSDMTVSYSDVEGGWALVYIELGSTLDWGDGNIVVDPLFADPNSADCHLSAGSPCIDAGDNTTVPADELDLDNDGDPNEPLPLDLDCRLRFADRIDTPDTGNPDPNFPELEIVDMGAYEYQCTGDLNGDGVIDLSDLARLLSNYRTTSRVVYPDGDLDLDGDVDLSDLAALLAVYGTTCE